MPKHNPPVGDQDLAGGHSEHGENIVSGGVGPSGSSFSSTGHLGGMGNTSDGVGSTDNSQRSDAEDPEAPMLAGGGAATLGDVTTSGPGDDDVDGDEDEYEEDAAEPGGVEGIGPEPGDRSVERASGGSSSRTGTRDLRGGDIDEDIGNTDGMESSTGGLAGTSR